MKVMYQWCGPIQVRLLGCDGKKRIENDSGVTVSYLIMIYAVGTGSSLLKIVYYCSNTYFSYFRLCIF